MQPYDLGMQLVKRVLLALAVCALAFAAYALLARFVIHGPVTSRSLARELTRESGSAGLTLDRPGRCRELSPVSWRCAVEDREGSGGATYRVQVEPDSSCWQAGLVNDYSEGGMPRAVDGCVHRWQWTVLSLL